MAVFKHTVDIDTERSEQNLRDLEDATRRATNELQRGDGAARRFGEAAGQIGTSAGRLGGILGRINPQFEEQARLVNDVADAAEVGASAWGKLGPVLARIGITGPIAAAGIAAVGTAAVVTANQTATAREELQGYQDTIERTRDTTNLLIQSQNALKIAQGDVTSFVADLRIQTALLNGEISNSDIAAGELGGKLADALRPQLLAAGRSVAETVVEIQRLEGALNSGRLNASEIKEAGANLEALRALLPTLQAQLDQLKEAQAEGSIAINEYAAALDAANEPAMAVKTTIEETTEAVLSLSAALGAVDLTTLGRVTGQDLGGGSSAGPFQLQDLGGQVDAQAARDAADRAARRQQVLGGVGTGLGAIANPSAALGLLGPAGGILQGLSAIGGLGAEGVEQRLDDLLGSITGGIEALPTIVGEVIPSFVIALVTELPRALIGAIPELVTALVSELPRAIAEGLAELLREFFNGFFGGNQPGGFFGLGGDGPGIQFSNPLGDLGGPIRRAFGGDDRSSAQRTSRAATTGRIERAKGAARLSIARSATGRGAVGGGVSIQVNQLGPADATQDAYLRTLARLQDADTGLRG